MSTPIKRQLRLSVPINARERTQLRELVRDKVDGARSAADLVRSWLAERFVRRVTERTQRQPAPKPLQKRGADLVGRDLVPTIKPPGVPRSDQPTTERPKRRAGKRLLSSPSVLVVREGAGHRASAGTKRRSAKDRAA